MPHEILFSLLDDIQNTKKDKHTRIKRKEIWKKSKRNRVRCFNIYLVVLTFLSITIKGDRW